MKTGCEPSARVDGRVMGLVFSLLYFSAAVAEIVSPPSS